MPELYTDKLDMDTGLAHTTQFVEFYDREVIIQPNPEIGRFNPEKRMETYCIIQTPGDTTKRHDQPVRDVDKNTYPRHWLAYQMKKQNHEMPVMGTPLTQWTVDQPELFNQNQLVQMQALGFQTVEQIAGMYDMQMQRVGMGAAGLKVAARTYLDSKNRSADRTELDKTRGELSEMKAQLQALMESLQAKQAIAAPEPIVQVGDKISQDGHEDLVALTDAMTPAQIRMAKARAARGKKVTRGKQHAPDTGAASHG